MHFNVTMSKFAVTLDQVKFLCSCAWSESLLSSPQTLTTQTWKYMSFSIQAYNEKLTGPHLVIYYILGQLQMHIVASKLEAKFDFHQPQATGPVFMLMRAYSQVSAGCRHLCSCWRHPTSSAVDPADCCLCCHCLPEERMNTHNYVLVSWI